MNTYRFQYKDSKKSKEKYITANSYHHAIDKAEIFLEDMYEDLDLIGLDSWDEVMDECDNFGIFVSDLEEIVED